MRRDILRGSLILKIYLIILGAVAAGCILFGVLSLNQNRSEQQRRLDSEKLDSLKQTERAFRMIFDITVGDLKTMSEAPEIFKLTSDSKLSSREAQAAIDRLQDMSEGSAIDAVWVWTPASRAVCSSYGSYVDISFSRNQKLIDIFGARFAPALGNSKDWVVFVYEGRIILALRVSLDTECYALAELNRNVLINYMYNGRWRELKEEPANLAYIYDMDGNTINLISLPEFSTDMLGDKSLYQTDPDTGKNAKWYRVDSEECSWVYLMPRERVGVSLMSGRIPLLTAILLAYMVFSSFITWAILRQVYGPITSLLEVLGHPEQELGEKRLNEAEFIGQRFNEQVQLAEQQAGVIEEVSVDIIEQNIRKLARREIEETELLRTFEQVGRAELGESSYALLVSRVQPRSSSQPELELGMCQRGYRSKLRQEDMGPVRLYSAFTTDHTCLTTVIFPGDMSASSMRRAMDGLRNRLLQSCAGETYNVHIGYSRICSGWRYLPYVYSDCLQKQRVAEREESGVDSADTGVRETVRYILHMLWDSHFDIAEKDWSVMTSGLMKLPHEAAVWEFREITEELVERLTSANDAAAGPAVEMLGRINSQADPAELDIETSMRELWEGISAGMGGTSASRKKTDAYVDRAIAYIEEHWSDPQLSVGDVSANIGISSQYLSSIFGTSTGKSLVTYINEYRVEKAIELLTGTDMQVKDIGDRCGFNTMQSFFRVFKAITGKPPGQYRKDASGRD